MVYEPAEEFITITYTNVAEHCRAALNAAKRSNFITVSVLLSMYCGAIGYRTYRTLQAKKMATRLANAELGALNAETVDESVAVEVTTNNVDDEMPTQVPVQSPAVSEPPMSLQVKHYVNNTNPVTGGGAKAKPEVEPVANEENNNETVQPPRDHPFINVH